MTKLFIQGDLYQLKFCVRTILSFLTRFLPETEDARILMDVSKGENGVRVTFCESLPNEVHTEPWIYQSFQSERAALDLVLGEDAIRGFMQRHSGEYSRRVDSQNQTIFGLTLPSDY